jgi:hypothetical protein
MFERMTDRARRVMTIAQEEARNLGHHLIGPEHFLLALQREGGGVAAKALEGLGVSYIAALQSVAATSPENLPGAPPASITFSPAAKKVLELSLREALQLGHNYVGTEHLLLALIRQGDEMVYKTLHAQGVEPADVRREVMRLLSGYAESEKNQHPPVRADVTTTDGKPPEYLPGREPVTVRIDRYVVGDTPAEEVAVTWCGDKWEVKYDADTLRFVPVDERTCNGASGALSAAIDLVKLLREHHDATTKTAEALAAWSEGR